MKKKELREFCRDDSLFDALLTMTYTSELITDQIHDIKIELKDAQRIKKSIDKRLIKGKEFYKKKHGREAKLTK
jgi:hypothetical protein